MDLLDMFIEHEKSKLEKKFIGWKSPYILYRKIPKGALFVKSENENIAICARHDCFLPIEVVSQWDECYENIDHEEVESKAIESMEAFIFSFISSIGKEAEFNLALSHYTAKSI